MSQRAALQGLANGLEIALRSVKQLLEEPDAELDGREMAAILHATLARGLHALDASTRRPIDPYARMFPEPMVWPARAGVYFARLPLTNLVKIGHASNVRARLRHMAAASLHPFDLLHVADGSKAEEAALHERFRLHHVYEGGGTELFRLGRQVVAFLEEERKGATA